MRASGNSALSMGKALIYSRTEMCIQANTKMGSQMERGSTLGETGQFMWVSLRMVLSTERGSGGAVKDRSAILTRGTMLSIRSMAMAYLIGPVETYTRENIKKTREMDMEK